MGIGDNIENAKDQLVGKAKEVAGESKGDPGLEIEGKVQQDPALPARGRADDDNAT
ncbi:CsbD family protein [Janibacter sp. UYMM211]|uniref:CsbD family protein n=1 Tax=Janibacter sp. UYMM211 TaxID=3156342 RepID=UPI003394D3F1